MNAFRSSMATSGRNLPLTCSFDLGERSPVTFEGGPLGATADSAQATNKTLKVLPSARDRGTAGGADDPTGSGGGCSASRFDGILLSKPAADTAMPSPTTAVASSHDSLARAAAPTMAVHKVFEKWPPLNDNTTIPESEATGSGSVGISLPLRPVMTGKTLRQVNPPKQAAPSNKICMSLRDRSKYDKEQFLQGLRIKAEASRGRVLSEDAARESNFHHQEVQESLTPRQEEERKALVSVLLTLRLQERQIALAKA